LDHGDDDVGIAAEIGQAGGAPALDLGSEPGGLVPVDVEDGERTPPAEHALRHRRAHAPDPDKSDMRCGHVTSLPFPSPSISIPPKARPQFRRPPCLGGAGRRTRRASGATMNERRDRIDEAARLARMIEAEGKALALLGMIEARGLIRPG